MLGGAGNDAYFVDNIGDSVIENLDEGTDAVFSTIDYTLTANVETLVLQGSDNLSGAGNALNNTIHGNAGNNPLNGGAGSDVLIGHAGNDTFVFKAGQADGDTISTSRSRRSRRGHAEVCRLRPGSDVHPDGETQWQIHSGRRPRTRSSRS